MALTEQKRRMMETMVAVSKGELPKFVKLPKEKVYDKNGKFIVKIGSHYCDTKQGNTLVYGKDRAFVFHNFDTAKNIANEYGGKVIRL